AHGFLGFDEIGLGNRKHLYFRGIGEQLERAGAQLYCPRVPPASSISARAARLADLIRALPEPRVNIVAHSMGGLDARFAISRLGLADKVASLVTIGTPHLGTPLADAGHAVFGRITPLLRKLVDRTGCGSRPRRTTARTSAGGADSTRSPSTRSCSSSCADEASSRPIANDSPEGSVPARRSDRTDTPRGSRHRQSTSPPRQRTRCTGPGAFRFLTQPRGDYASVPLGKKDQSASHSGARRAPRQPTRRSQPTGMARQ